MDFKSYLVEKVNNTQNEADIVLHQIIDNVDESHADYTDNRLDFNVGIMIKRSSYSRLYMTIFNSYSDSVRLGKNTQKDGFTLVINTSNYPSRMEIDTFLSDKNIYNAIKSKLIMFIDNYQGDEKNDVNLTYETNKRINTPETFEVLYSDVVKNIKSRIKEYKNIAADLNHKLDKTANEAEKQILVRSLETLKDEYFGDTFKKFKKLAVTGMDVDLTRFDKDFKAKFDTRLENYYEYVVNNL